MTTPNSIKKEFSSDLTRNPDWPLFSGRPDLQTPGRSVSAYTLTWTNASSDASAFLSTAADDLARRIVFSLSELRWSLQIFAANLTIQPRTATVLYRKIWNSLPLKGAPNGVEVGTENLIECDSGVRFAGVATIPPRAITWMLSAARQFDIVVPLLLPRPLELNEESALRLACIAFPTDGRRAGSKFDWAAFACSIAAAGGCCARIDAGQSARHFEVDFFAAVETMPTLSQFLGGEDSAETHRLH